MLHTKFGGKTAIYLGSYSKYDFYFYQIDNETIIIISKYGDGVIDLDASFVDNIKPTDSSMIFKGLELAKAQGLVF